MGVSPPQNQIPGPPGELQKGWSSQPGCRRGLAAEGKVILRGGFGHQRSGSNPQNRAAEEKKKRSVSGESVVMAREAAVVSSMGDCLLKPLSRESR